MSSICKFQCDPGTQTDSSMYHEGNRRLQGISSRVPDRRPPGSFARAVHVSLTGIHRECAVFLSGDRRCRGTAGLLVQGRHAGIHRFRRRGPSGAYAFPDYGGNGMIQEPWQYSGECRGRHAGIAMHGRSPQRLRVNGTRRSACKDPALLLHGPWARSSLLVRVTARVIFPNCPRYIPDMQLIDPSIQRGQVAIRLNQRGRDSTASRTASTRASRPSRADASGERPRAIRLTPSAHPARLPSLNPARGDGREDRDPAGASPASALPRPCRFP